MTGATTYVVELYRLSSDWFDVFEVDTSICTAIDCVYKIPYNLSFEYGSWTWRVRAKDGTPLGSWSVDAVFDYMRVDPISAYGPVDGATVNTSTPTFTWEESEQGMYAYVIEVWTAENTRVVSQSLATGTVCSGGTCTWMSTTSLLDGDYHWRVMGKKWPNTTGWTPMEAFTVSQP